MLTPNKDSLRLTPVTTNCTLEQEVRSFPMESMGTTVLTHLGRAMGIILTHAPSACKLIASCIPSCCDVNEVSLRGSFSTQGPAYIII